MPTNHEGNKDFQLPKKEPELDPDVESYLLIFSLSGYPLINKYGCE